MKLVKLVVLCAIIGFAFRSVAESTARSAPIAPVDAAPAIAAVRPPTLGEVAERTAAIRRQGAAAHAAAVARLRATPSETAANAAAPSVPKWDVVSPGDVGEVVGEPVLLLRSTRHLVSEMEVRENTVGYLARGSRFEVREVEVSGFQGWYYVVSRQHPMERGRALRELLQKDTRPAQR